MLLMTSPCFCVYLQPEKRLLLRKRTFFRIPVRRRSQTGDFPEHLGKVALRRKTQAIAYLAKTPVCMAEQFTGLLNFLLFDKIGKIDAAFLFKACGNSSTAFLKVSGNVTGTDGFGDGVCILPLR